MTAALVGQTIQLILAPVVMVSACAIIISGVLSHYASVNDRLRSMNRERLDVLGALADRQEGPARLHLSGERLREIDFQLPRIVARLRLIHDAVLTIYGAVICFLASMLSIAVAAAVDSSPAAQLALIIFLAGSGVLLVGVLIIATEIRRSDHEVLAEVERVLALQPE